MKRVTILWAISLLVSTFIPIQAIDDSLPNRTEEVVISDDVFKRQINYELGKGYVTTYNPTLPELESIKTLNINMKNRDGYIYINDISGLEHMKSLEKITFLKSFVPANIFEVLASLPNLKTIQIVNGFTSGNQLDVGLGITYVNDTYTSKRIPFDPHLHLGDIGKSSSVESITIVSSFQEVLPQYQTRNRGKLLLSGLGELKSLKNLELLGFADIDIPNLSYLTSLPNLEKVTITQVPVTDISDINTLVTNPKIKLNFLMANDYTISDNLDMSGLTMNNQVFITSPQFYTWDDEGILITIHTGIIIPKDTTNLTVKAQNTDQLLRYSHDNDSSELIVKVKTDSLKNYSMYNYISNLNDQAYKGLLLSVSYDLSRNNRVVYNQILVDVRESVTFDLNTNDTSIYETKSLQRKIDDQTVSIPEEEDFGIDTSKYQIVGWFYDKEGTQPVNFNTMPLLNSITLYAQLEKIKVPSYSVTFESNGGTIIDSLYDLPFGSLISEPSIPEKSKSLFKGWFSDKDITIPWNFESDTITDNITLYAGWEAITFKVDFESNGGSAVVSLIDIEPESRISKPTNPTKNHYRFTGWFRDKALSIPWNFESDTVIDNITLYAGWEGITYNVDFESNGGSAVASLVDIEPESPISKPTNPTKNHYRFTGWFRDKDLSIPWNFESDTVTDNITLYAGWEAITFKVDFESNGGSAVVSLVDIEPESRISKPINPTKNHYRFTGWSVIKIYPYLGTLNPILLLII